MLYDFFFDYIMKMQPIYIGMQLRGAKVDPWARGELTEKFIEARKEAAQRIEQFAGYSLIPKKAVSNKLLMDLLYNKLKLPIQYHHKTHKPTANKEALDKLQSKVTEDQREVFQDILEVRDLGVLLSTFLEVRLDDDGRLRWSTNQAGTKTGRLSTSASPFWSGGNIQNWSEKEIVKDGSPYRNVRDIIIADAGKVFIYADGSAAEARIVAELANDPGLFEVFLSGLNIHAQMATRIFEIPLANTYELLEELKATPMYKLAKIGSHACNYDMSASRAAMIMKRSFKEAQKILDAVHNAFPGIRGNFHKGVQRQLQINRTLVTPFGRRREFHGRWCNELFKQAYAQIPQSTIGDWTQIGTLRLVNFSEGRTKLQSDSHMKQYIDLGELNFASSAQELEIPIEPIANQHDGLLTQTKVRHLRAGIKALQEAMTFDIHFDSGRKVRVPVEVKIGTRWGSLHAPTEKYILELETSINEAA